ncbi:cardiolipin synthase [Gulosibacter sp. 10]|uniref:cardiolipin synthase n=1 Tax=Gulosibacter sp. 10 TaxID=1255570 RepID=UPI00097EE71A|nr:cardiolipin synthase [Gulosibacter sp. 10]SJM56068.1 Cardiolipin synthetase [Gulosibacter sp. 10]
MIGPFAFFSDTANLVTIGVLYAVNILIVIVTLFTIGHNRRPMTSVAWLLAIALIPYVGLLLFLLFGTNHLPKFRRRRQAEFEQILRSATEQLRNEVGLTPIPEQLRPISQLAENLTAIPHLSGNRLEIKTSYDETIDAMAAEIDRAQDYVHVIFYAMGYDEVTEGFFDALERAVRRGVTVRVLYDQVGSFRYPGYRRLKRRLDAIGCEWHRLYSIWPWESGWQRIDLRNHRKLVVVDGRVAWMGSQNLIARDYHRKPNRQHGQMLWQDLMLRVAGPMALGVDAVFRSDWYVETGHLAEDGEDPTTLEFADLDASDRAAGHEVELHDCQLVPSGPGYEHENNLRLFAQLLYQARERVVIASPYFAPDDSMRYAITTAVQRGVEVHLHVSEVGDQLFTQHAQQSYYEELLRVGVHVWLYRAPYILHSKHMTVDGEVSMVGSSNMDMRSFTLNAEMMLIVYGQRFAERMAWVEHFYRVHSRKLTLDEWLARPRMHVAFDDLCRLTSVVQ